MPKCSVIKRKHRRVCIGDLDTRVEVYQRNILPPVGIGTGAQNTQEYSLVFKPWALINSLRGVEDFDGVEISGVNAWELYIRYDARVNSENRIRLSGKIYAITSVEDLDARKEFMRLLVVERGDESAEAIL